MLFPAPQPYRGRRDAAPRTFGARRNREGPHAVFKAQGRIDGFEVWDSARLVIRQMASSADEAVNEAPAFARLAARRQPQDDIALTLTRPAWAIDNVRRKPDFPLAVGRLVLVASSSCVVAKILA